MNRSYLRTLAYIILAIGMVFSALVAGDARDTAKDLQQARYEDQQRFNDRVDSIDARQDALGCTLESLQRRHPDLFAGAEGPGENAECKVEREEGTSQVEPSLE